MGKKLDKSDLPWHESKKVTTTGQSTLTARLQRTL